VLDKDVKSDSKTTIFVKEVRARRAIELVLDQKHAGEADSVVEQVLIYPNTPAAKGNTRTDRPHFYLTNADSTRTWTAC